MKHIVLAGALACALCAGVYAGENVQGSGPASETVVIEEASGAGSHHIDATGPGPGPQSYDYGVDQDNVMPPYESYDENTGVEDLVPSDTFGELN